jgi:hypothetical protein
MHRLVDALQRLLTARHGPRLVVLLGAGVSVPTVSGVARLTRSAHEFADQAGRPRPRSDINEPVAASLDGQQLRIARYVEALQGIREVRGRDGLRAFVQRSILRANDQGITVGNQPMPDRHFIALEHDVDGWRVPEGLLLLADILRTQGHRVHRYLLTTNFDPLLEVALRRAGLRISDSYGVSGPNETMAELPRDGSPWTVVHLHGDSHDKTLHNPAALSQPHEEVENWLADQLRGNHLLVLGYSGWDGLIQRTLARHFGRDAESKIDQGVEVLWAVYENPADHPHVNTGLADFFERYRVRGVSAYYGIDRDRLLRNVHEELSARSERPDDGRPAGSDFYRMVRLLNSDYDFGVSRVRTETKPTFVFWPHRLRPPHLIHGVHALTAALLGKLGLPIELYLDDTDMTEAYASQLADEFIDAVKGWFASCGAEQLPKVYRISAVARSEEGIERADRLWAIARDWYSATNSPFDALVATKVVTVEGDTVAIGPTVGAHRILRPIYTWLALDDALDRYGVRDGAAAPVTLGGVDEQKMWDLWQVRPDVPAVASIFVPRLESPTGGTDLWQYSELRRETPFGVHDLERFLVRSAGSPAGAPVLRWVFTAANRLAALASGGAVRAVPGPDGRPATWREVHEDLSHSPDVICGVLAETVGAWFYHGGSLSW